MADIVNLCDVDLMLKQKTTEPDFVLDGKHFGRGDKYACNISNEIHLYEYIAVRCWKVTNDNLEPIKTSVKSHFFSYFSYIILGTYIEEVFSSENETLIETKSESKICFYWKGAEAEKGNSPLPDEIINNEHTPVERIFQWSEIPAFLRLFKGTMIVHTHRVSESSGPHLYILRGTIEPEVHFFEIPSEKRNLRSRTSFILVHDKTLFIWHGCKSDIDNRKFSTNAISEFQNNKEFVFGLKEDFIITEIEEGDENVVFKDALKGTDDDYYSLINVSKDFRYSPRLFYFNSITGNFMAVEVEYALHSSGVDPFPFLQDHLYTANQPALFLLDNFDELWFWYGWKPRNFTDGDLETFISERKVAMATATRYWKTKFPNQEEVIYVVRAGEEPLQFTNLFPQWKSKTNDVNYQIEFELDLQNKLKIKDV